MLLVKKDGPVWPNLGWIIQTPMAGFAAWWTTARSGWRWSQSPRGDLKRVGGGGVSAEQALEGLDGLTLLLKLLWQVSKQAGGP